MIKGYKYEVSQMYEKIRDDEARQLRLRKEEIAKKYPEIIDIENEIGKSCVQLSLNALKNTNTRAEDFKRLKDKITDLRVEKSELLVQHGYPITFLDMHYRCSKCNDTGYVGNERCLCYNQKLVQLYYKDSDLKDMVSKNNFNNFKMEYFSPNRTQDENESPRKKMEKIVQKSKNFISNFNSSEENLLFYGNPGTGKTFLSHCIAKELLDRGYLVVYRTAEELIQNMRHIRFDNDETLEELVLNCDLLIIDDLGTEQINDFSKTELFNLLNRKLLKNKKMIVSTNFALEDLLKNYTDRITSRLLGNFTPCKFSGDDIRIQKNLHNIKTG